MGQPTGRKPIPKNLHMLQSPNWRAKEKLERDYPEPAATDTALEPPPWLARMAREEWVRVVDAMRSTGVLTDVDLTSLEGYCYWYARFRELAFQAELEGPLVVKPSGTVAPNPLELLVREASRKVLDFAAHLGFTPAARMRLGKKKETPGEDPFGKHEGNAPRKRKPGRPKKAAA